MPRITREMNLFLSFVLFLSVFQLSFIKFSTADICDSCSCIRNDCDVESENCSQAIEEWYICDGAADNWTKSNKTFDLNSILWPSRNVTVSATFNNFKFTYLTK